MTQLWIRLLLLLPLACWSLRAMSSDDEEGGEEVVETGAGDTPGATGGTASNIPQGDQARAREEFQEGQRLYVAGNYRDAVRAFQAAYEAWHHPHFLWNIAQAHRRARQWTEALNHYNRFLREFEQAHLPPAQFPQEVYLHIADCLFELNQAEEALQTLQRYLDQYPEGRFHALAQQCVQQRRAPSVVDRRDPGTVQQARQIHDEASALHQRRQYREAAERYLEGYRQHASITEFLYNAAASYRAGRLWRDAIRTYEQYLQTPGASPDAHVELAQCHNELGHPRDAVDAYRRYLQAEPNGTFAEDARQYIQSVTEAGVYENPPSEEETERARQAFQRGLEHFNAGRFEQARQELEASYDVLPTRVSLFNIAVCYQRMRQWERALTNFENFLRGGDAGTSAAARLGAARCEIELGHPEEAMNHIHCYLRRADEEELPDEEANRRWAESLRARCGSAGSD